MINWSEVAPALRDLFSTLATIEPQEPTFEGRWADKSAEVIHFGVQKDLILRVTNVSDVDGHRSLNDDGSEEIGGIKQFILEVRVDSHEHGEEDARWAWSMIDRIRTRLFFSTSIQAMLAVNVGLVDVGAASDVSYTFERRRINAALFDVTMNAGFSLTDPVPVGWFERIDLTTQFKRIDDTVLSSPLNITAQVFPPEDE